mgnify:CR=1 FL=1
MSYRTLAVHHITPSLTHFQRTIIIHVRYVCTFAVHHTVVVVAYMICTAGLGFQSYAAAGCKSVMYDSNVHVVYTKLTHAVHLAHVRWIADSASSLSLCRRRGLSAVAYNLCTHPH